MADGRGLGVQQLGADVAILALEKQRAEGQPLARRAQPGLAQEQCDTPRTLSVLI
jgi:hypothetical protein